MKVLDIHRHVTIHLIECNIEAFSSDTLLSGQEYVKLYMAIYVIYIQFTEQMLNIDI